MSDLKAALTEFVKRGQDAQRIAELVNDFYSLPPSARTKEKLIEMLVESENERSRESTRQ
jgi:hypothetical protein